MIYQKQIFQYGLRGSNDTQKFLPNTLNSIKTILDKKHLRGCLIDISLTLDLKIILLSHKNLKPIAIRPNTMSLTRFEYLTNTNIKKLSYHEVYPLYIGSKRQSLNTLLDITNILPVNKQLILNILTNNTQIITKLLKFISKNKLTNSQIFFLSNNHLILKHLKLRLPSFTCLFNLTIKPKYPLSKIFKKIDSVQKANLDGVLINHSTSNQIKNYVIQKNLVFYQYNQHLLQGPFHTNIPFEFSRSLSELPNKDIPETQGLGKGLGIGDDEGKNKDKGKGEGEGEGDEEDEGEGLELEGEKNFNNLTQFTTPVNLGCVAASSRITDIVPIDIDWPQFQNPQNFATGASGPNFSNLTGSNLTGPLNTPTPNSGQPSTLGDRPSKTPFQSSVYLNSDVQIYNIAATANGYGNVTLSTEGLLWTLWPLAYASNSKDLPDYQTLPTYFDNFTFGTSLASNYPIGQMGFFVNNGIIGCTPMMNAWLNTDSYLPTINDGQPGLRQDSPSMIPGIQGFDESFIYLTGQNMAIMVIKVSEEIARIFNPAAGASNNQRFIYVGYDAWSVFRLSSNPTGPMMSQTYVSPQSVTGSVTNKNLQVVLPPNFPQTLYFKNVPYLVPISANHYIDQG